MAAVLEDTDEFWEDLLAYIEERKVIPAIWNFVGVAVALSGANP